jgi:hypothetical protein
MKTLYLLGFQMYVVIGTFKLIRTNSAPLMIDYVIFHAKIF